MRLADELRNKMQTLTGQAPSTFEEEPFVKDEPDDEEAVDDPLPANNSKRCGRERPVVKLEKPDDAKKEPVKPKKPVDHDALKKEAEAFTRAVYGQKTHKCLLGGIDRIDGTDSCCKRNPATLNKDTVKLHYVIHYKQRGVWDKICPGPHTRDETKIQDYKCNACNKKFKNYLNKKEYPGWGTFICHIASEHGKLYDAMKEDPLVDMTEAIEFLRRHDKRFADQIDEDRSYLPEDEKFVTIEESVFWRSHAKAMKQKEEAERALKNGETPKEESPRILYNVGPKKIFACPHCSKLANNTDRTQLRLHLFTHYKDRWMDQVNALPGAGIKKDLQCNLDGCTRRRVTGATPDGVKTAMACHLAINHEQLQDMLENDSSLDQEFLKDLYSDRSGKPKPVEKKETPKQPKKPARKRVSSAKKKFDDSEEETTDSENSPLKRKGSWSDMDNEDSDTPKPKKTKPKRGRKPKQKVASDDDDDYM